MHKLPAIPLQAEYREYVWGGRRLRPQAERTAEAWVIYEGNRILSSPWEGQTLAQACAQEGDSLLGSQPMRRTGMRFPLLIKLLDCAEWLSLQVHPDDAMARELEGGGQFGKTEAWYFIEAEEGASILAGLKSGVTRARADEAIRGRHLLPLMRAMKVRAGESISIPAGLIHALGPGLLLYEVQQTSDWTYRVYDWDRPETPQRPLHIEKSVAATKSSLRARLNPAPDLNPAGEIRQLLSSAYFQLELGTPGKGLDCATGGTSFHALTALQGEVRVSGAGWQYALRRYESLLIPASAGEYQLSSPDEGRFLRARAD